ncbi:hypothetical protein NQ315_002987 [Exocentrus adspersus]|uniref:Ig-like domain-containing protein n=1 Tax=Exocentrus adspersus TaxID=1586481 RepID=A0AAV8W5Y0_9CUCU|nr:hypothetical protein NQ315_002987 [Exocentrus adspersus]
MSSRNLLGVAEPDNGLKSRFVEPMNKPPHQRPYFDDVGPRNVTAVVGQSAVLNCRVKHPGDRTVSWMRKRDLHILTSGIHTYTGDARFSVLHPDHSDDWDLRVEYVQKRDAGVYECQVNTEPKINLAIMLNVDGQKRNKIKKKPEDLPDGIKAAVRSTIYDMKENGKHITVKTINEELKGKEIVHVSNGSIWFLVKMKAQKVVEKDTKARVKGLLFFMQEQNMDSLKMLA